MRAIAVVFALLCSVAHGQTATLNWTAPTTNTDGSALTNLSGFKAYWGKVSGTWTGNSTISSAAARTYTVTGLTAGTWYFTVSALTPTAESALSNVASKLVAVPPSPPVIPAPVSVGGPVYSLQITKDSIVSPQVATVAAGKPCDPSQQYAFGGASYMRIDSALVTPLGNIDLSNSASWTACQ